MPDLKVFSELSISLLCRRAAGFITEASVSGIVWSERAYVLLPVKLRDLRVYGLPPSEFLRCEGSCFKRSQQLVRWLLPSIVAVRDHKRIAGGQCCPYSWNDIPLILCYSKLNTMYSCSPMVQALTFHGWVSTWTRVRIRIWRILL